jgi:hypothetical protein
MDFQSTRVKLCFEECPCGTDSSHCEAIHFRFSVLLPLLLTSVC